MNEARRQAYMDAMGIDSYFPRLQLPAAPQSRLCEFSVLPSVPHPDEVQETYIDSGIVDTADRAVSAESTVPSSSAKSTVSSDSAKSATTNSAPAESTVSRSIVSQLFSDLDTKSDRRAPVKKTPVVNFQTDNASTESTAIDGENGSAAQKIPQLSLTIVRGANVLLVDDGPQNNGNGSGDKNREYLQLIKNMLFAVGAHSQSLSLDSFKWPMTKNAQVDQSEEAAKQTLESFLSKQVLQSGIAYVLIMGETAKKTLCSESSPNGELMNHAQLSAPIICTLSGRLMLEQPALKRIVWRDLQALARQLKTI